MSQQPELTSPSLAPSPAPAPTVASSPAPQLQPVEQQAPGHTPQRIPRWLERAELFLRVMLRMYIGLAIFYAPWSGLLPAYFPQVLAYLPWSRALWDQNPLFMQFPALGVYASNGAVRGLVSGLGLLNMWIACQDALRHWDG
jgi:hypothetical protein